MVLPNGDGAQADAEENHRHTGENLTALHVEPPFLAKKAAPVYTHLACLQHCEMIFVWSASNRYAARTSVV